LQLIGTVNLLYNIKKFREMTNEIKKRALDNNPIKSNTNENNSVNLDQYKKLLLIEKEMNEDLQTSILFIYNSYNNTN